LKGARGPQFGMQPTKDPGVQSKRVLWGGVENPNSKTKKFPRAKRGENFFPLCQEIKLRPLEKTF